MATLGIFNAMHEFPSTDNTAGFVNEENGVRLDPRNHTPFPSLSTTVIVTAWNSLLSPLPIAPLPETGGGGSGAPGSAICG